jgi:hypothetical protein
MRLFRSIENKHGVEDPDYRPSDNAPEVPTDDFEPVEQRPKGIGGWVVASLFIPLVGFVVGIRELARDRVGPGLALILVSFVCAGGWTIALVSIAAHNASVEAVRAAEIARQEIADQEETAQRESDEEQAKLKHEAAVEEAKAKEEGEAAERQSQRELAEITRRSEAEAAP